MKRRKPHKPVGSPLKFFAAIEHARINKLLEAAGSRYRLSFETVFEMYCRCDWKCEDTGVRYADSPLHIVWIDPIEHYGLTDNLRVVSEAEEQYYISSDVHKRTLRIAA